MSKTLFFLSQHTRKLFIITFIIFLIALLYLNILYGGNAAVSVDDDDDGNDGIITKALKVWFIIQWLLSNKLRTTFFT